MDVRTVEQALALPEDAVGRALLGLREGPWLDRTSVRIRPQKLADALVGMGNAEGGVLVVGLAGTEVEGVDGDLGRVNELRRTVQLAQGGIMADYVPFYFGPRSPMLYSIMCGNTEYGRAGRGQVGMVHLVFHMEVLARDFHGRWCFIDGHLTRAWAQFGATMDELDELDERVDELLANVGADHTPKVIACPPGRSGSVWPHGYYYEEGPT